jgi:hypothetical protein
MENAIQTVLIGGNYRGGTSVLTKMVVQCGFALPGEYGKNLENRALQAILHRRRKANKKELKPLIEKYDATHPRWVLKHPGVHRHLSRAISLWRSPGVILILRDAVASAQSEKRNGHKKPIEELYLRNQENNAAMLKTAQDLKKKGTPVLLLSYEHLLQRTASVAEQLVNFLGSGQVEELMPYVGLENRSLFPPGVEPKTAES